MSSIDPRLGEFVTRDEFAKMINRSPRTVSRLMRLADGLPHMPFGNETLIPIPEAREWMASRVKRPNPRRRAA